MYSPQELQDFLVFYNTYKGKKIKLNKWKKTNYITLNVYDAATSKLEYTHVDKFGTSDVRQKTLQEFFGVKINTKIGNDEFDWTILPDTAPNTVMNAQQRVDAAYGIKQPIKQVTQADIWRMEGKCEQCGFEAEYIKWALTCPRHGQYWPKDNR